jgi:hypothetical protein
VKQEHLDRLLLMATHDPKWDLSEKDITALRAILDERTRLKLALEDVYNFTLPAGTIRASQIEDIAHRHSVTFALRIEGSPSESEGKDG